MKLLILLLIGCLLFTAVQSKQLVSKGLIMHEGTCPQPPLGLMCRRIACMPQMVERTCKNDGGCKENEKCCRIPCSCKIKCVAV
ncbi:unnamed protein product [Rotaria sp. Silwood2]|nr:unnamed protein product [Rotaria sp. Silwood2]CAF3224781.1 unnamed protein product [Rotaria sp. Silwood2]CAF3337592.1 unnamed protein product [Rotaria sp. Silwood2]CAF4226920.1 unnamed protein product [Rotaria sp. Silwood2]CAF4460948.1 unnamed protein product [Rotaria sp. Silwood2]